MTLDELLKDVDEGTFLEACEGARRVAPRTGSGAPEDRASSDLAHTLCFSISDLPLSPPERMLLALDLYERLPTYAVLFYLPGWYQESRKDKRAAGLWERYRRHLSGQDEALAQPAAYSLWCDFFEDEETVEEAWAALVGPGAGERLLERVLGVSGPVPYALKEALYERLLPENRWHPFIFRSLLSSCVDVYGKVDRPRARQVFRRLCLPADTEHVGELRSRLR
jgi:hypothetical protein